MKSLNKDLKETQKRLNNVLNAFENGFGNDELNTRLKELSARKDGELSIVCVSSG